MIYWYDENIPGDKERAHRAAMIDGNIEVWHGVKLWPSSPHNLRGGNFWPGIGIETALDQERIIDCDNFV